MKKLFLLAAILVAAATTSHAGVRFGFGLGLPLPVPPLPGVVIGAPPVYSAPAPAYYGDPYCPPSYYAPPAVVVEPPVYFGFGHDRFHHYGYRGYRGGWDRHGHGHGHGHRR